MEIRFQKVLPTPLIGSFTDHPLWGKEYTFSATKKYLITAESGKGKSTLIHLIHGSRRDFTGSLYYDSVDSSAYTPAQWAELRSKKIAFVFQDLRLFPQLSGFENLQIPHYIHPLENFKGKAMFYAEKLGIADHLPKKCGILSLGQQQRVAIVRALLQDFEYLLMDEPFSHLDEANQVLGAELIHAVLKEKNAGMLLSSLSTETSFQCDENLSL